MLDAASHVALLPALFDSLTVARHGSVARAAKALHKTASAVSQQLRRIERHFGVELFEKAGRGVRLSAAGEAFLGPATRLFDEAESVFGLLGSMSAAPLATLRLAASDYLGKELLAPVLRAMHESGAPLRFAITTAHSADAVRLLELGEVDAAVVSGRSAHPSLDEHLLFEQPFVWVAPRRDRQQPIDERLAREPLLRLAAGSPGRSVLDAYLERRAISAPSTIDVSSVSLLLAYAEAGVGIGLAPALSLLDADASRVESLAADVPSLAVRLALRANYRVSLPMAAFLERVKTEGAAIARQLADRNGPATKTLRPAKPARRKPSR